MSGSLALSKPAVRAAGTEVSADAPALPHQRFAFVDALRGLAALAVCCHHIDRFGPLWEPASYTIPETLGTLFEHGRVGVKVFFVISGFVIAYSVRKVWVTPGYLGNFALRRSIRLE